MAEAFRNMSKFRGRSQAEWAAWLQQIIRGQAVRLRRHNAAEKRRTGREVYGSWSVEDEGQSPTSAVLKKERMDQLRSAVMRLPEPLRQVVLLRNFDEQSFTQIGQQLGKSPRAVRRLWAQAIRLLARRLHDE